MGTPFDNPPADPGQSQIEQLMVKLGFPPAKSGPGGAQMAGVLPVMADVLPVVRDAFVSRGLPVPVITSGTDRPASRQGIGAHPKGLGLDFRGRGIDPAVGRAIAAEINQKLGDRYFSQFETFRKSPNANHLHVQWRKDIPPPGEAPTTPLVGPQGL